jgi:hypothetical protein
MDDLNKPKKLNQYEQFFIKKTAKVLGYKSGPSGKSAFKITDKLKKLFE